jgi:hypothetical protein
MIKENDVRPMGLHGIPDFLKLAITHKKTRTWLLSGACYQSGRHHACRYYQFPKLIGIFSIVVRSKVDVNQDSYFTDIGTFKQVISAPK